MEKGDKAVLKDMFQRIRNAETSFVASLREIANCTEEQAQGVMRLYLKNKLAKLDTGIGRINVKHGAYLEAHTIRNAIRMVEGAK